MSKRRSNRLLKKLKLGAYQELGFEFSAETNTELTDQAEAEIIEAFLTEVIEVRDLTLGGWVQRGFIAKFRGGSATDDDRKAVEAWLTACKDLKNVKVGELVDAWYV